MSRLGIRYRTGLVSNIIGFSLDPDAAAFIKSTGLTSTSQQLAVNQLVVDLKDAGLWYKMPLIYPFVGGTAVSHSYNLKNVAINRLVYLGGWTHTSLGAQPNGTNGYANTLFNLNQLPTPSSNGMGYYSVSNIAETSADPANMGVSTNINTAASLFGKGNSALFSRLNGPYISVINPTMAGMFSTQRISTTLYLYINSTSVVTAATSGNLPINSLFIGTAALTASPYSSGYVRNDFRFVYTSEGLTSTEVTTLYNIVQNYQTSLSRQV